MKPTARPGQIHNWSDAALHISLLFRGHSNTNTQSQDYHLLESSRLKILPLTPALRHNKLDCCSCQALSLYNWVGCSTMQRVWHCSRMTTHIWRHLTTCWVKGKRCLSPVSCSTFHFCWLVNNCCSSGRCFALLSPARDRTWEDRRKAQKQKNSWTRCA